MSFDTVQQYLDFVDTHHVDFDAIRPLSISDIIFGDDGDSDEA